MIDHALAVTPFDKQVLSEYPYPIAVGYRRVLEAPDWPTRIQRAIETFDFTLRIVALSLIAQYLIRDAEQISDSHLNTLLFEQMPRGTLGAWKRIFFDILRAYKGQRDLFFMPELYDLYWDTSSTPHRPHRGIQEPYDRLISIRNELAHSFGRPEGHADWEALGNEVLKYLISVCEQLTFIRKYTLLCIVERQDDFYVYFDYTGEHPRQLTTLVNTESELQPGWIYLSRGNQAFLPLNPLLIPWQDPSLSDLHVPAEIDVGIFSTFTSKAVTYLAPALRRNIVSKDPMLEDKFAQLLADTLARMRGERLVIKRLTWADLQTVAERMTGFRFGDVREKFRKDLYLQRQDVRQAVDDFLASDKTAFLLLGKTGVGKSSFFLSLADEYHVQDRVCLLLYNGAHLQTDRPFTEIIGRDFANYVRMETDAGPADFSNPLMELARIEGIEERHVVLIIDAVNENANARELLSRINELIVSAIYPWFKVVISSRPEAWRAIKRGRRLPEHLYYSLSAQLEPGVELQPFGVEMTSFTLAELPEVYTKYQEAYQLQTPYTDLPRELRNLLNEPLTLKLIAEIYRGQAVPRTLRLSDIHREYIDQLVMDSRLDPGDLSFVEMDLLPFMIYDGHFDNKITAEQVNYQVTLSGQTLRDLIHNDDQLSSGRAVNQSFKNLVDAEILLVRGTPTDYEIGFKYGRFYEYYASKRIFALAATQPNRSVFYSELIEETQHRPFLWEVVKSAMVREAKERGSDAILPFCYTKQQRVKELMVQVLTDLGRDYSAQVEELVRRLVSLAAPPSSIQTFWRLIRESAIEDDIPTRNAKKIAIEVAGNLGFCAVLQSAASQRDQVVRTAATRYTYYLWQRDPKAGFTILELLANEVTRTLIPNPAALESTLQLSLVLFFDNPRDSLVLAQLQSIWQRILGKVLVARQGNSRFVRLLQEFLRERLISLAISVLFRLLHEMPDYNTVNYVDLASFFQLPPAAKIHYRNLIQYIDVNGSYAQEQMEADCLATLPIRDLLTETVLTMVLSTHVREAPVMLLPFLKRFLAEAYRDPLPSPYLSVLPGVLGQVLDRDPGLDAVFDFFVHTVEACQEYYAVRPRIPSLSRVLPSGQAMFIGDYSYHQYRRTGSVHTSWLKMRIDRALEQNDLPFFSELLQTQLPLVGIERRQPNIALEVLELFVHRSNPQIDHLIGSFLTRLRSTYPDEVDDFLEGQEMPEEIQVRIKYGEPMETLGQLIGIRGSESLIDAVTDSPYARAHTIRILARSADCKDIQQWLDYAFHEVVNLVYGGELLHKPF